MAGSGARRKSRATRRERIQQRALELLDSAPRGIRYSELVNQVHASYPDFPKNTIYGNVWNLDAVFPEKVYKAARGLFRSTAYREAEPEPETAPPTTSQITAEESFYEPFADWIVQELEECTKAVALGGNRFRDKWGTPDVLGIREPRRSDIIALPMEIVSAEIKIDKSGLITAFGQACAYKTFSHKSYIVIPIDSLPEDIARIDVLCRTMGLGLILFNAANAEEPDFEIRVRAAAHDPDMFYVNKYMKLVESQLFS